MQEYKGIQFKYIVAGFLVGICVLLIYIGLELIISNLSLNVDSLVKITKDNPLLWILFLMPFVISALIWFYANIYNRKLKSVSDDLDSKIETSNQILEFVNKLNNDETDAGLKLTDENNELGKAVLSLRNKIEKGKTDEQRRRDEDFQRNWTAEGLAKFGEILRHDNDDLVGLSYNIISNLVKYVNANQGGLFLINDEGSGEKFIELTAQFAYDRRKYADKRLVWGEGLIGSCILEKQSVFLKEVPENYLHITSGMGKSTPRNLLITPLKINEDVHGVVEIASFSEFKTYEVEFIEKVAESIATTVSNVKTNLKTTKLLSESREQSEALKSQEEEIRQNLEELQATQEEAKRQAEEFVSFSNSVNHTLIRADYLTDGTLIYANTKFLHKLGYLQNSEVEGQHISMFINVKDRDWFNDIWDTLANGGKHFEGYMKHVTKDGNDLWTMATYTCVRNELGKVRKILFLAIDTTEFKKQNIDFKGQLDALNKANIKAEFFTSGAILDANRKFRDIFGYALVDIYEKNITDLLHKDEKETFDDKWGKIIKGKPIEGVFQMINNKREEKWIRGTFSPVYDMYNEISKIIFVGNDITNEKIMEITTIEQAKILKTHEEKLKQSEENLSKKLKETREAVRQQFKEIEKVKIRNEKTLEGVLDAIVTINEDGKIEFFNKAAEELWGLRKKEVLGKEVDILFTEEQIKNNEFVKKFTTPGTNKIVGVRQEISITNKEGLEIPVLILLSEAIVEKEPTFTAFIQNISVDLF